MTSLAEVATMAQCNEILEFWKEFDIESKRIELDQQVAVMREQKAASINGRKKLNELTKQFRAKSKEDQLVGVTDILKTYQDEIDQLSRRSKLSESSFSSLYKVLSEAPNPVIAIESLIRSVGASSSHQFEIERLKNELAQYEEEFQQLKNQDITIRRLEDQLEEFREQIEDKVVEEVDRRMADVEQSAQVRIAEIREAQKATEKKFVIALETMKQAQAATERAQNQLYDISSQSENRISALLAENSIIAEGSERAMARVAELEAELENTKNMLGTIQARNSSVGNSSSNIVDMVSSNEDMQTLQLVVSELRQEIRRKEDHFRNERQKLEHSIREFNQQLHDERGQYSGLKQELLERPTKEDYRLMRKQLKLLQRLVFNANEEGEEEEDSDDNNSDCLPLEQALATRLKSLEVDLAECRRQLSESQQSEAKNAETIIILRKSVESSSELIARLESDLETQSKMTSTSKRSIDKGNALPRPHTERIARVNATKDEYGYSGSMDLSELLGVDEPDREEVDLASHSSNMVTILQAQRDRYKDRLSQVESSLLELQQQVQAANAAKSQLEADNLALYEKIRYLQSYSISLQKNNKAPVRYGPNGAIGYAVNQNVLDSMKSGIPGFGLKDRGSMGVNGIVGRYHDMYEHKMNPFEEFSQHEKQRKLQELSVADRLVLNTVTAIVSNKFGRSILVGYFGIMHFLVFSTLYYLAHHTHSQCDNKF